MEELNLDVEKKKRKWPRRLMISIVAVFCVVLISLVTWFLVRTPDERNVDLQLKGTAWKSVHWQIGSDYVDMESEFMKEQPGALLNVYFYPVVDYVKLEFRNGSEIVPYTVTDFNAADIGGDFYGWSICFDKHNILSINMGNNGTYFFEIK